MFPMTRPGALRPGARPTAEAAMSALGELRRIKGSTAPKQRKQNKAAFLFLLPWFVGLALVTDRSDGGLARPVVHAGTTC